MEYHGNRFQDASLVIFRKDIPVAVFPAESNAHSVYAHRGLTYAGWIVKKGLNTDHLKEILGSTLEYLKSQGYENLYIKPVPDFFCHADQSGLTQTLLEFLPETVSQRTFHTTTLPFTFRDRGKRWGARRAKFHQIVTGPSENYADFWNQLLIPNLQERYQSGPVHTLEEILLLKSRFPENIQLRLAFRAGELLGGTVLFLDQNIVHTQYIASSPKGRKLRALDLLFAGILEEFNATKKYLSLGTSLDSSSELPIPGLVTWKESLGAKPYEVPVYRVGLKA